MDDVVVVGGVVVADGLVGVSDILRRRSNTEVFLGDSVAERQNKRSIIASDESCPIKFQNATVSPIWAISATPVKLSDVNVTLPTNE